MKGSITTVFLVGITLTGIAMADCQPYLSAEDTIECINYDGAASSYLDYNDDGSLDIASATNEKTEIATVDTKD